MRAYVLEKYGRRGARLRDDVPEPAPGAGQVLVRVHGVGLNPVDVKTRDGLTRIVKSHPLPIVLGNELSGVVEAVGAGVTSFAKGDRVLARVSSDRMGALAELAVVDESLLAQAPSSRDLVTLGGVPLAGLTAWQGMKILGVATGQRVLVTGGAGGVGTFGVHLAKHLGAHVTTTASPRGAELCRSLGADEIVDYTTGGLARIEAASFDAVFDTVGDARACIPLAKPGSCVLSVAAFPTVETARHLDAGPLLRALFGVLSLGITRAARRHGVRYEYLFMKENGADLAEIAALVDAGKLRVVVDRVVPLDDVESAFTYVGSGRAKGKVIVRVTA